MGALTQNYWFIPINTSITDTSSMNYVTFVNAKGTEVFWDMH